MKRPALPGNTAATVLNYILFRIITSLDGTNVKQLLTILKHFLELNKWQFNPPTFWWQKPLLKRELELKCCCFSSTLVTHLSNLTGTFSKFSIQINLWVNLRGSSAGLRQLGLPKQTDFAHESTAHLDGARAQYKEQERQIMCNPLTIVKPTHQLWKATSRSC